VRYELITRETAARDYYVVLSESDDGDEDAAEILRAQMITRFNDQLFVAID